MIAIKNIERPKNCENCKFNFNGCIIEKNIDTSISSLPYNCPLVEIITCKDCNYCRSNLVEGIACYWCDKDKCVTNENFYCANAVKGRE